MARFHLFGTTRQSAEGSGFFRWFMLDPVEVETAAPGRRAGHYRPNGPAFHALTELIINTDDKERLLGLELRLARRFIDDERNGLFARDISKSLLRDAIGGPDAERLADLMNQIEFPKTVPTPFITARRAEAPVADAPTPGYEAFLGLRGRWEHRGATILLVLENYVREAAPWFRLVMTAR